MMKKEKFNVTGIKIVPVLIILLFIITIMGCEKEKDDNSNNNTNNSNNQPIEVKDVDGNIYKTIKIGNQWWMTENLKTTKYNDSTPVFHQTDNQSWATSLQLGTYCWYNNDFDEYGKIYGALYNWYAVETGKLCPTGWHVPTIADWGILIDYLGGVDTAGNRLKTAGTIEDGTGLWRAPNAGENTVGFSALPAGSRHSCFGHFVNDVGSVTVWWSSTNPSTSYPLTLTLVYSVGNVIIRDGKRTYGFSVRCVRN